MVNKTVAEVREHMSEVLDLAEHKSERIVVTRHGKPVAAIISIDDLRAIEASEDHDDNREADKRMAKLAAGKEKLIPWAEVLRKNGR